MKRASCREHDTPPTRLAREAGLTLIELSAVVMIVGVFVAFGLANWMQFLGRARFAACVSNQRSLIESSVLYVADTGPSDGTLNSSDLVGRWIAADQGECPNSDDDDYADYTVEILDGAPTNVRCLIRPKEHLWGGI